MVEKDRKKTIIRSIAIFISFLLCFKILFQPSPVLIRGLSLFICPQAKYFFKTKKKLIALTIDDIPDNNRLFPHTTLEILDVLNRYEAKATFFVIADRAKDFPSLMKSIVKQGHELGNHLTHDEPSIKLRDRFETEFVKADKFLRQFGTVKWFRPGHGLCNAKMSEIAQKYNYQEALGSIWSYDTNIPSPQFSRWYIKQNIRPGAIIILHDSQGQSDRRGQNTVETLGYILPELQQQGYRFVTLSELDREVKNSNLNL